MLAFVLELKEKLGLTLEFLDLGGGIGVPYHDGETVMGPDDLARALEPIWKEGVRALGYEPALWLEPGRFLVAPSGFLVTRVNSVKTTPVKTFVNVDAGFETLVRPAMYQAYHRVRVVGRTEDPMQVDVAGNVCETGDILAAERILPRPHPGDLVVVLDAGAYGFSMASEYNARPLPAEVLVDGDKTALIRAREKESELFRDETGKAEPAKR
jgi:diaminopimelate decarboxylase